MSGFPSPETIEREYWRCKESPIYFLQNYVYVKDKEKKEPVKFELNIVQLLTYLALKERFWKPFRIIQGKQYYRFQNIRLIIVKYRQIGISTLIVGLIIHECLFWSGTDAAIFLHKDEYSRKMLERLKEMMQYVPSWLRPTYSQEDLDSRTELSLSKIDSRISVGTPGKSKEQSGDKGRSETLQACMISEMPRYPFQADFMQGIAAAAKFGNQYIESTPLMHGDLFSTMFWDGLFGRNEWLSLFFPWFIDTRNRMKIDSEMEREEIIRTLSLDERLLMEKHSEKVIAESIKWRRYTIKNDYNGDERRFLQEYPEDPEKCFASHGFNYFEDPEFDIKLTTTSFNGHPLSFTWKNDDGLILTFRRAIPGHFHIISVDCAEGLGGKNDYSVIEVIDYETNEQVFEWRSNTYSHQILHDKIYEIWKQYPAMVIIENNEIGHGVIAKCRVSPNLASDTCFQWMIFKTSPRIDGFRTGADKATILSEFYQAVKEAVRTYVVDQDIPKVPVGLRLSSPITITEMGTYLNKDGELGAEKGSGNHDDTISSLMNGWKCRKFVPSFRTKYQKIMASLLKAEAGSDEKEKEDYFADEDD